MNGKDGVYSRRGVWAARAILLTSIVSLFVFVAGWAWSQSTIEGVPTGAEMLIQAGIGFSLVILIIAGLLVSSTGDPFLTIRGKEMSSYVVARCPDSVVQFDDALRLVGMNNAAERKFGYRSETIRGTHLRNLSATLFGQPTRAAGSMNAMSPRGGGASIAARELAFRAGVRLAYLSTPLLGFAEIVMAQLGDDHPCRADLEEIGRSSVQVVLVAKMLEVYGGVRRTQWLTLDLNQFLKEIEPDLYLLLKPSTRIVLEPAQPGAAPVTADPELTRLSVMLLARNAEEAMPEGGNLRIRAEDGALIVADGGRGLGKAGPALFEPVFEIRGERADPEHGIGLGLHVAHTAAALQGAELTLTKSDSDGTEFRLTFSAGDKGGVPVKNQGATTRQLVREEA